MKEKESNQIDKHAIQEWFSDVKIGQKLFYFDDATCEYCEDNLLSVDYDKQVIVLAPGYTIDYSQVSISSDGKSMRLFQHNGLRTIIFYKDKNDVKKNLLPVLEERYINIDNAMFFIKY